MNAQNKILLTIVILWFVQLLTLSFEPLGISYSYGEFSDVESVTVVQSTTSDSEVENVKEYKSIVFVGDVLLARNVEKLMNKNGESYPFSGFAFKALSLNPAVVGNFESSMATPHVMTPENGMRFSVSENYLLGLKKAGFTHLSLANNHSLDAGEEGYQKTKQALNDEVLTSFGHQNILSEDSISYLVTPKGIVALIGINTVSISPSDEEITIVMKKAAEHSDWQIAYVHWGDEYVEKHNKTQSKFAEQLIHHGADLIVGHHPHVVQDIQFIDGVVVVYSLGNFIFDQYFSDEVQEGLLLSLVLSDQPSLNLVPVSSVDTWSKPLLMSPENHFSFLHNLAASSDPALSDYIKQGYLPLDNFVASSSKTAIIGP